MRAIRYRHLLTLGLVCSGTFSVAQRSEPVDLPEAVPEVLAPASPRVPAAEPIFVDPLEGSAAPEWAPEPGEVLDSGMAPPVPTDDAPHTDAVVVFDQGGAARHLMPTEPAPLLYARELVDSGWLRGPGYQVEDKVFLSGGFPTFFLNSPYGNLEVDGVELLAIRIEELQALAELDRISKLDVFGKSASRAVRRTARALRNVLSSPIQTLKAVPAALGRKIKNTYEDAKEGAKNLADQAREQMRNEDGDVIAANPFLPPPPPEVKLSEAEQAAQRDEQAKQVAKKAGQSYIGYNKSRRELAQMLGIDPYTRNPLILARLDELAWASLAGSAGTNLTIGAMTGGVTTVVSNSRQLNQLVWELPEPDLKKRNRAELDRAGFTDAASRALIRNGAFPTSLQTSYVDLAVQFVAVPGSQRLLELGAEARDELDARYLVHALAYALEQQGERPYTRIRAISNQPVFEVGRRTLVVVAPADYLYLSAEMRAFLDLEEFRNTDNRLLTHARLSTRLQEELQARRWRVQLIAPHPGLPYVQPDR